VNELLVVTREPAGIANRPLASARGTKPSTRR